MNSSTEHAPGPGTPGRRWFWLAVPLLLIGAILVFAWATGKGSASNTPAGAVDSANLDGRALEISERARVMASVETAPVERRSLHYEVRAFGKVQYNERALATVTARVDGYIERLFVDFTGVDVKAGDHLAEFYSPEMVVAQSELFFESRAEPSERQRITDAVKLKLRRWELSDEQIEEVLRTKTVKERVTLVSPVSGTVVEKMAIQKSAVKAGDVLYRVANLDSVWVYLDIYEHELGLVRYGQEVEVRAESQPKPFTGRVWFINPVLNEETRTVKVILSIANPERQLKPGMFVSASVHSPLLADGTLAPTGVEGKWTCPMHPQVLKDIGGKCPTCGMQLEQIPALPADVEKAAGSDRALAIPSSAVLDAGLRKIVYVEKSPGIFAPSEVQVGPRAGGYYPVISGVAEGDRVATRGAFLLDSQFQIQGMASLFYPEGQSGVAGHQHGGVAPPPTQQTPATKGANPTPHKH